MKARPEELHELQPALELVLRASRDEHAAWQAEIAQAMAEFARKSPWPGDMERVDV